MVEVSKTRLKSKRELIRRTYRGSDRPATVVELCKAYLKLDKLDGVVWAWLGDSLSEVGRFDEARIALQTARGLVTTDDLISFVVSCQGELAHASGDNAEAERFFREATGLRPSDDRLWIRLGNVAFEQGNLNDAEMHFRTAIELDGRFRAGALFELGRTLRARGEFFEARRVLKAAVKETNDKRPREALVDVEQALRVRSRSLSRSDRK